MYQILTIYSLIGISAVCIHSFANYKLRELSKECTILNYFVYLIINYFIGWIWNFKQIFKDVDDIRTWYIIRDSINYLPLLKDPTVDKGYVGFRLQIKNNWYPVDNLVPDNFYYILYNFKK